MKYVVAVSGGVDSVVLLDMLVRENKHELVVAHFDHGIRPDSEADARFVWALAQTYKLPCEVRREELGSNSSEALARKRRYEFLRDIAKKYEGQIVTAHHADDLVETVAINLVRGTGWRGLAVFGDETIARPLIGKTKRQLHDYALERSLEWVEDETNQTDFYERNKIRRKLNELPDPSRQKLIELYGAQTELRKHITHEVEKHADDSSRYFFSVIPDVVAFELLRAQTKARLTRPQLARLLLAIKTARPGNIFEAGDGIRVRFTSRDFFVENTGEML